jgi:hypothetical protein
MSAEIAALGPNPLQMTTHGGKDDVSIDRKVEGAS